MNRGMLPGCRRMIYSMSKMTVWVPPDLQDTAKQLVADGLASSEGDALRVMLIAATSLDKEAIMGTFHGKALQIQRANPGMTYREACSELGKRGGAKARAAAERRRKSEEKAKAYMAQMRRREGDAQDEPPANTETP